MNAAGKLEDLIQMLALDPVLKLARLVAGVRTYFERGDDHRANRPGFLGCLRARSHRTTDG